MKLTIENPFDTFYKKAKDVIVFDDIIPEVYQNWLVDCIKNEDLMWHRKDAAISDMFEDDPRNGFCNFHYLFDKDEGGELSPLCNAFMPLALQFREKLQAECLFRMRVNCVPAWHSNQVQLPHVDSYHFEAWNVIYYIDDSNGDTIIYDERTRDHQEYLKIATRDMYTVKTAVSPKKGRAVAIKGDLFHASTLPMGTWRPVLNMVVHS
jgi:hypothetical protein|tara:strand:- start:486 stop:1109 length:624 start_codon:yes stop_codon:yes gene_type:complete